MNATKSYYYESLMNHKFFYDVSQDGIKYRRPEEKDVFVKWEDIGRVTRTTGGSIAICDLRGRRLFNIHHSTPHIFELLKSILIEVSKYRHTSSKRQLFITEMTIFLAFISFLVLLVFGLSYYIGYIAPHVVTSLLASFTILFCLFTIARQLLLVIVNHEKITLLRLLSKNDILLSDIKDIDISNTIPRPGFFTLDKNTNISNTVPRSGIFTLYLELRNGERIFAGTVRDTILLFITVSSLLGLENNWLTHDSAGSAATTP